MSLGCLHDPQASQKGAELTATLRALTEAQARTAECEKGMASAKAVAEAAERSLQDMTAQYVSAKRDLIAASKQMATVAQEHNGTLVRLLGREGRQQEERVEPACVAAGAGQGVSGSTAIHQNAVQSRQLF